MTGPRLSLPTLWQRFTVEDGSLPNGRAEDVGPGAWTSFLDALARAGWDVTQGDPPLLQGQRGAVPLPSNEEGSTLHVRPSWGVLVNVFPNWGDDSIWFDFDVREMQRQQDADALMAFLRLLGQSVQRPVLLSYEGADHLVFARYEPRLDALVWTRAPST
ncbi:hypothetical protein [Thalassiella azotivora]